MNRHSSYHLHHGLTRGNAFSQLNPNDAGRILPPDPLAISVLLSPYQEPCARRSRLLGIIHLVAAVMSSSPTKDDEKGVVVAADEVELARMGYKQELKLPHLSVPWSRMLTLCFAFLTDANLALCRYVAFKSR